MNLSSNLTDDLQIITVNEPRIDASVAIRFKDRMRDETNTQTPRILLDLSQVDFIDSSGLGAIVAAMKQLGRDRKLDLAGLRPNVDRVFRLTRMDTVFAIHPTVAQAVTAHAG